MGKPYPVTYTICNFDTVPFDSIAEYRAYRACAIAQHKASGCLRTMEDWNQFYLRLAQRPTSLPAGKKQKQNADSKISSGSDCSVPRVDISTGDGTSRR